MGEGERLGGGCTCLHAGTRERRRGKFAEDDIEVKRKKEKEIQRMDKKIISRSVHNVSSIMSLLVEWCSGQEDKSGPVIESLMKFK